MTRAIFTLALGVALAAAPAWAQDTDTTQQQMAERFEAPPEGWQVPRTEWGDPDLRGMWPLDYLSATPRVRPGNFGTRAFMTDEEYERAFSRAEADMERYEEEEQANMMAMGHWNERQLPLKQTSLIVEPANGQYPPLTELGRQYAANEKTSWNTYVFEDMDDFGIMDRCLTRGLPGAMLPAVYNMGIRVAQSPGLVAITIEMIHETRMVYLDGREAPPPEVQFDLGYSVGHWEGDTLVIETTNFRPGRSAGPAPNSDQMRMTERLTLKNPDQVHYEAWIEDPLVMEGAYKVDFPWQRDEDYEIFEYACHEGNVQIRGYITATSPRFADERAAAWRARGEEPESGVPVR